MYDVDMFPSSSNQHCPQNKSNPSQEYHLKCCNTLSCQKYNCFIQNGIDLDNVAPLEDSWLENIQELVPCQLRSRSTQMELLVDEIKEDYLLCVKTAICIYLITLKVML